ncbi:tyrosine-protein kinase fyna, partial [Biomphalaria glabrata]
IVEGMIYVHKQKIIHCDLRAVNILVGNDGNIKIADFGLARSLEDNNGKNISKEYLDTFPVRWTAPEGLFNDQFSLKSDVWSFGIVMYELITFGREPFPGYANDEVKALIEKKVRLPKPPKLQIQDVPESYFEIMNSCCSYSIQKRPNFIEVLIEFKCYFSLS